MKTDTSVGWLEGRAAKWFWHRSGVWAGRYMLPVVSLEQMHWTIGNGTFWWFPWSQWVRSLITSYSVVLTVPYWHKCQSFSAVCIEWMSAYCNSWSVWHIRYERDPTKGLVKKNTGLNFNAVCRQIVKCKVQGKHLYNWLTATMSTQGVLVVHHYPHKSLISNRGSI